MTIPFFYQADPRWGEHVLGKNDTIHEAGCKLCSAAMLCSALLDEENTPLDLDNEFRDKQEFQGDLLPDAAIVDYLKDDAPICTLKTVYDIKQVDFFPAIGEVHYYKDGQKHTHFVLVKDSLGKINDPGHLDGEDSYYTKRGYIFDNFRVPVPLEGGK